MFGPRKGVWSVYSKSDPRWNKSGEGYGLVAAGGAIEQKEWLKKCREKYGKEPNDLEMSFYKD